MPDLNPKSDSVPFSWGVVAVCAAHLALTGINACQSSDADGDDWTTEDGDCNDQDASMYPGAPETCDGRDNDCDGEVDEGCGEIFTPDNQYGHQDFDVDGQGRVAATQFRTVNSNYYVVHAQCFDESLHLVGEIDVQSEPVPGGGQRSNLTMVAGDFNEHLLVSWREYPENGVFSRLLDKSCQPLGGVFKSVNSQYGEFYDVVFDTAGNFVVAENDNQYTRVNWYSSNGDLLASDQMSASGNATHLGIERDTGAGIVLLQGDSSGNQISYRRWSAPGVWIESGPVGVPVGYAYWYDGATVGMNDNGEFVIEWRYSDNSMRAAFYNTSGSHLKTVTFSTEVRASEAYFHDPFRRRHAPIETVCGDFVLGEVYSAVSDPDDRYVTYFRYTPSGQYKEDHLTFRSWSEGISHRLDGEGRSYFSDGYEIEMANAFLFCD